MARGIVAGVGINDLRSGPGCDFYARWSGIVKRCYAPSSATERYQGCTVAAEWLIFSNFKRWMQQQPWQGNEIDKDILCRDRKIYQPETCVFIPRWLNVLMIRYEGQSSRFRTGVKLDLRDRLRPYKAQIHNGQDGRIHLGSFKTEHEAHQAWRSAKSSLLMDAANRYSATPGFDKRVLSAVLVESHRYLK